MIPAETYESLGELLRDALTQFKSNVALIEANRKRENTRLTYLDFKKASAPIAACLQEHGIGADERAAIIMSNQSKWLIGANAIFQRGGILIPLDYKLTAPEQASLLAHCKPRALIVEYPLWKRFDKLDIPLIIVTEAPKKADLGDALRWEDIAEKSWPEADLVHRTRSDVATIVYSSGTGGRAKGCMLTHGNYLSQFQSLSSVFSMEDTDVVFSILPTNHAIDFMTGFIVPFACGAAVVHQRTLRPEYILRTMEKYHPTHIAVVPMLLSAFEKAIKKKIKAQPAIIQKGLAFLTGLNETLTRRRPNPRLSRRLLKPIHAAFGGKLKVIFCGGAFTDQNRAEFFYRLGLPVAIGYGLTEACTVATLNDLKPFRADSVGSSVPGMEIKIQDPNHHGVGEVYLRGDMIMKGYLDDPELTEAVLGTGWFKTGDLGFLDASNHLHLVGRSKNMIVTEGGKNIYPEDIESAFDGVCFEEMVIFAENYIWPSAGELTGERLIAVVRPEKGTLRNNELEGEFWKVMRRKNRRLPDFKRISGVLFWKDDFPRTASMKLKRHILADEIRSAAKQSDVRDL